MKIWRQKYSMSVVRDGTPIQDGFRMPAEFERHRGTLMIYPTRPGSWGRDRSESLRSFGQVFAEILKREELFLLAGQEFFDEAEGFMDSLIKENGLKRDRLHLLKIGSDDAWARDVGPTFVTDKGGNIRGINWKFNAWGGEVDGLYASWDRDDAVAAAFCHELGTDCYDADPFVLEGGSIHSDGEGTVIVTESCLLSSGRNPDLTKQQIEDRLKSYLGAEKVLWLPRGIYNDETNEHVDNVCAFTSPGEVVLAWCDDENDPQHAMSKQDLKYLESVTDARGRHIKVHKLPVPSHPVLVTDTDLANYEFEEGEDMRDSGERLAASYVNFYFVNGAALVPQFGGENAESDQRALEILRELLPGREVIGVDARAILLGGGNIHCITQQIPACGG
jgi:agmatine deiminase